MEHAFDTTIPSDVNVQLLSILGTGNVSDVNGAFTESAFVRNFLTNGCEKCSTKSFDRMICVMLAHAQSTRDNVNFILQHLLTIECFDMFDEDGDGMLNMDEFCIFMQLCFGLDEKASAMQFERTRNDSETMVDLHLFVKFANDLLESEKDGGGKVDILRKLVDGYSQACLKRNMSGARVDSLWKQVNKL